MIFVQVALALAILCVCVFGPGFFIVRRLRWNPLEKLCGAVVLSVVLLWLATWTVYLSPVSWTAGSIVISLVSVALLALAWSDARKLFGAAGVRRTATAFGLLVVWALVILATIRHYSGGTWFGDWLEHFQRTLIFLHRLSPSTEAFGGYRLAARPPLAHAIAAFVMAQTQDTFEIYQVVFASQTLLIFLSCSLLLPLVARPWKSGVLPLAGIFALSPVLMVNTTLPGTKPVAAALAIAGLAFYLRGWKKNDPARMSMAFAAAAAGSLAHYSAAPYAVFLGLHYLVAVFPHRRARFRELARIAIAAAVPLAAWLGWCIATFGAAGTISAALYTSVSYKAAQGSLLARAAGNLIDSIVPHLLRGWPLVTIWGQQSFAGYIRDNAFLVYQSNVIFTMGLVGGPLVCWLLIRRCRGRGGPERTFWLALIPFSTAACFVLAGERDQYGSAHIALITMMAIGMTFLAGNFRMRSGIGLLIIAGCAIDFGLGVFLQTRIEHLESKPDPRVFARIQVSGVVMDVAAPGPQTLSRPTGGNWFRKHGYALAENWLRGLDAMHPGGQGITPAQAKARKALAEVVQQDDTVFGGWFRRHGGELVFLGDYFGDTDWTSALMVIGAIGALWTMARYAPRRAAAATAMAAAAPARPRARKKR